MIDASAFVLCPVDIKGVFRQFVLRILLRRFLCFLFRSLKTQGLQVRFPTEAKHFFFNFSISKNHLNSCLNIV